MLTETPTTLAVSSTLKPGVVAELDDFRQMRVFRLELLDRLVQGEQIVGRRLDPGQALGQLDGAAPALRV